jgi:heme-degrading monooxygenase HmoA
MFTRMIVFEAVSDGDAQSLVNRMQDHVRCIPDLIGHSILAEERGRMVILTTDWDSREACLQYHASRLNRQFVAGTQHLLVGNHIVKLFQNQTERKDVHEPRNS